MDFAVAGGKIADMPPDTDPTLAEELFDVRGYHAVPGMSNGQLVMYQAHVCGRGGRFITTATGAAAVRHEGLQPIVVGPADCAFYRR